MEKIMFSSKYFTLPNEILDGELNPREIAILSVLYCFSKRFYNADEPTAYSVQVAQTTLAYYTGLSRNTVAKYTNSLYEKGFILDIIQDERPHEVKKYGQSSVYELKPLPESGFFFAPKDIFSFQLSPKLLAFYLRFCRDEDSIERLQWNSINDLWDKASNIFHVAKSVLISMIRELTKLNLITKTKRRPVNKNGKWIWIDNVYRLVQFAAGKIVKKMKNKKISPLSREDLPKNSSTTNKEVERNNDYNRLHYNHYNTKKRSCQVPNYQKIEYDRYYFNKYSGDTYYSGRQLSLWDTAC
jgi:hypothetical protein